VTAVDDHIDTIRLTGAWQERDDPFAPLAWAVVETALRPRTVAARYCAHCGGTLVPSRTRWYDRLVRYVTHARPYRCGACHHRAWRE
jgi:hypothetical protein